MTTTIAFINMKGGVAKSTTTVATAQILAGDLGKKVLVIDLDPQTNATVMLIGDSRWKQLNDDGHTVAQIFRAALNPRKVSYDLDAIIQHRVGSVTDVRTLSLLPSSLDLITLQEELVNLPAGAFHAARPIDILYRALQQTINANEYDYILIDCPPSLGLVTLNGLRFAHGYVIPTVTDVLSTYGIPQIIQRVSDFAGELSEVIEPYGILATKFQVQSTVQKNQLALLRQTSDVPVFEAMIPQANEIAAGAEFQHVNTLRQKWGGPKGYKFYREFVDELIERISSEVNA